jgi:Family of unknown function (DUF6262)
MPGGSDDLFTSALNERLARQAPLAARMRPRTIDEVVGQDQLLARGRPLRTLIDQDRLSSVILWGPPGCRPHEGGVMTAAIAAQAAPGRPRPERAIDARRRDSTVKVAAVQKAVTLLGRTGAPMTRAAVSQLAGVSRSFTFENEEARTIIAAAQTRTKASAEARMETVTAQREASWRERALNGEDQLRKLRQELTTQRRLVGDLIGQLREPDGTWIGHDRDRLRKENDILLSERNQLVRERDDLLRKLNGARANFSRLTERRVTELFPDGPGKTKP